MPLIGFEEVHRGTTQPPPPFHPKFVKIVDGGLPNAAKNSNNGSNKKVGICNHHSAERSRIMFNIEYAITVDTKLNYCPTMMLIIKKQSKSVQNTF